MFISIHLRHPVVSIAQSITNNNRDSNETYIAHCFCLSNRIYYKLTINPQYKNQIQPTKCDRDKWCIKWSMVICNYMDTWFLFICFLYVEISEVLAAYQFWKVLWAIEAINDHTANDNHYALARRHGERVVNSLVGRCLVEATNYSLQFIWEDDLWKHSNTCEYICFFLFILLYLESNNNLGVVSISFNEQRCRYIKFARALHICGFAKIRGMN